MTKRSKKTQCAGLIQSLISCMLISAKMLQIALVGAPNVGKSSLVQLLSSGMPEICDYPFTTRTVKMGHFFVDGNRHQVSPSESQSSFVLPQ